MVSNSMKELWLDQSGNKREIGRSTTLSGSWNQWFCFNAAGFAGRHRSVRTL